MTPTDPAMVPLTGSTAEAVTTILAHSDAADAEHAVARAVRFYAEILTLSSGEIVFLPGAGRLVQVWTTRRYEWRPVEYGLAAMALMLFGVLLGLFGAVSS